jgi:hypothetical protein
MTLKATLVQKLNSHGVYARIIENFAEYITIYPRFQFTTFTVH